MSERERVSQLGRTLQPLCPKCRRVVRRKDKWTLEAGSVVHAPGLCRGPRFKRWYVVAYDADRPVSVGLLPDNGQELTEMVDGLVRFEIRLVRMNSGQLNTLLKRMGL